MIRANSQEENFIYCVKLFDAIYTNFIICANYLHVLKVERFAVAADAA